MHIRRTSFFLLSVFIVLPNEYVRGIVITVIIALLFESIVLALVALVYIGEHMPIRDRYSYTHSYTNNSTNLTLLQ